MKTGDGWSWISKDLTESADLARGGWERVKEFIAEERYEFLLLDEFTYPLKWGWIDVDEVVEVLVDRPGFQHVVITGRDAPQALIDAADLVSEVTLVKHQMAQGHPRPAGDRVVIPRVVVAGHQLRRRARRPWPAG